MRAALRMLLEGRSQEAERTLRRRFLTWEQTRVPNRVASPESRRVGEIEARVCFHRDVREQRERETHEAAEARRKTERASYLTSLLEDEDSAWSAISKDFLALVSASTTLVRWRRFATSSFVHIGDHYN
jgi:hypothetical protein